jgi:lipopolysaccharide heptosyltransferase II
MIRLWFKRWLKRECKRLIEALLYLLFAGLGLASRLRRRQAEEAEPSRILVIRLDLLGDVLNSMPAVDALRERYPRARITMLTLPYAAAIPQRFACVDVVLSLDTNRVRSPRELLRPAFYGDVWRLIRQLRESRFDLCLSLYGRMASLLAFASGAPRRLGFAREAYPFLLTEPLPGGRFRRRRHETAWDLALAAAAGAVASARRPRLEADSAVAARMQERLRQAGVEPGCPLVGIHGGAVNGSAKRWPAGHWAALADRLIADHGCAVVLTGSAGEHPIAQDIVRRMGQKPLVLTGTTDLPELLAVLSLCQVVVSGDSGPLHLAVALGRATVALYGPTDPLTYGPTPAAGQSSTVIRLGLGCSPCYSLRAVAECPYGRPACMIDIPVQRVLGAVLASLGLAKA